MTFFLRGDLDLSQFLKDSHPPAWLDSLFRYGTYLGDSTLFLAIIPLISIALWRIHSLHLGKVFLIFAVASSFACEGTKFLVSRPRPDVSMIRVEKLPSSPSFPSGHTMVATTVYGGLAVLLPMCLTAQKFRKFLVCTLILLPIFVGLSRIYLGVHYLSDVLAGWLGGGAFIPLMAWGAGKKSFPLPDSGQNPPQG